MKIKEIYKMNHSYLSILLVIVFSLFSNFMISQSEANYLGVKGLKVKNNIAYFEFSAEINSENTCLGKLNWNDENYKDKRTEDYNQILHPISRFDKNYFVWSYAFGPCVFNHENGSSRKCDTPRTANKMALRYRNNSPVSVGQYLFGREGLRSIDIECNGSYLYSTENVLTLRFSKINVEMISIKRGMEDKYSGTLIELVTVLENLTEAERNEYFGYELINKLSEAASYSFETLKTMHVNAVNLDGL